MAAISYSEQPASACRRQAALRSPCDERCFGRSGFVAPLAEHVAEADRRETPRRRRWSSRPTRHGPGEACVVPLMQGVRWNVRHYKLWRIIGQRSLEAIGMPILPSLAQAALTRNFCTDRVGTKVIVDCRLRLRWRRSLHNCQHREWYRRDIR